MAKKNGTLVKIAIALISIILVAVFTAGGFWILTAWRLDTVEADIKTVEGSIESIKMDDIPKAIEPIKSNIKSIKETDLPNIEGDIDYHDDRLYEQEKEVFGVKKEIGYLNEKMDRSYKVQEQILKELQK